MTARVDNEIYRRLGHAWWDDAVGEFSTIRFFVNPVRAGYFARVRQREGRQGAIEILDVGCGGGILSEELARAGARVTGVDPAPESIETARAHAAESGLDIRYEVGAGERIPFADASFDAVVCCDVLEHVDDVPQVVAEIARVLRPGGIFFYDTINRTVTSWVAIIKVMQEWRATAFAQPNAHVFERFIKPEELRSLLEGHGFVPREMRGISAGRNPIGTWLDFRRRAQGRISFQELGRRLAFRESGDLRVSYMGYALRSGGVPAVPVGAAPAAETPVR